MEEETVEKIRKSQLKWFLLDKRLGDKSLWTSSVKKRKNYLRRTPRKVTEETMKGVESRCMWNRKLKIAGPT